MPKTKTGFLIDDNSLKRREKIVSGYHKFIEKKKTKKANN